MSIFCAGMLLVGTAAFAATGPVTSSTGSAGTVANANTVTVTVPGLIGVDLESNLAWNFNNYNAALAATPCASSNNQWPVSITCASAAATNLLFDPTNVTDPGIGAAVTNGSVTTGAGLAGLSGTKAIWLAFFCSKSAATQPTYSATLAPFGVVLATHGFNETNFIISGDSANNTGAVGVAGAPLAFNTAGTAVTLDPGTLGNGAARTFGWTRADQVVTMRLPNTVALAQGTYNSTLFFTIAKP